MAANLAWLITAALARSARGRERTSPAVAVLQGRSLLSRHLGRCCQRHPFARRWSRQRDRKYRSARLQRTGPKRDLVLAVGGSLFPQIKGTADTEVLF
jgi:hypothetical protein